MRIILLVPALLLYISIQAQKHDLSANHLVSFVSYDQDKFKTSVSKFGFEKNKDVNEAERAFIKLSKDRSLVRKISKLESTNGTSVVYQTTSQKEYKEMLNQLATAGYSYPYHLADDKKLPLYQKHAVTVQPEIKKGADSTTLYLLNITKKFLPKPTDIRFAEDLLALTSHEYIAAVYGSGNVKKDIFYLTATDAKICTVLFPNTALQVVFIWRDEVNYKDLAFVFIGCVSRTQLEISQSKFMEINKWKSSQGIYPGMPLRELSALNGNTINIYGWGTEDAGFIANTNSGRLNLTGVEVELGCIDCKEDKYYTSTKVINSARALKDNRRIYVASIVILPK